MVKFVSMVGAARSYLFSRKLQVSYPHYIDRVYDTKAGPLSDVNLGIFCYVIVMLDLHLGI